MSYSVSQRVVGRLLILGQRAEAEFANLRVSFPEPEKVPGLDKVGLDVLRVLYGGGLCDMASFDLRTKGEYHDDLDGLLDFLGNSDRLSVGAQSGDPPDDEGLGADYRAVRSQLQADLSELEQEKAKEAVLLDISEVQAKLVTGTISPQGASEALLETAQKVRPVSSIVSWSGYVDTAQQRLQDSMTSGPELVSGLLDLDKKIRFRRANMVTIAARTSHGKSAMLMNMVKQAVKSGLKVGYWCGEDYHVFPYLFASSMFDCPITYFTDYDRSTSERRSKADAAMMMAREFSDSLYVYPAIQLQEWEGHMRTVKPDVLMFDYVQKYAEQFGNDDMRRSTSKATSQFQDICRRYNAFGFMSCQVKRGEGQYRPSRANTPPQSQEPSLYDLKESGDIENYSDAVLILHWPWRDTMDETASSLDKEDYRISIAKDKLGPCGKVRVRYNGPTLTFNNRFTMETS